MKVLIYLGLNQGSGFDKMINGFDKCYGFEAIPELAEKMAIRYKNDDRVEIINAAVCGENKEQTFYISTNILMESSSLGELSDYYRNNGPKNQIRTKRKITVPGIVLSNFLKERGIDQIDTYVSDIEGMDYFVLNTIKEYVDDKRINHIQVEAECDYWGGESHDNLPSNKETLFYELLSDNYELKNKQQGNYNPKDDKRWFHRDLFFDKK
jgi:FkbM family methyltransferase